MNKAIEGAMGEAVELVRTIGQDLGGELKTLLKEVQSSMTAVVSKRLRGEMDQGEAEMIADNWLRSIETEGLLSAMEKEKRLLRGAVSIGANLLKALA
jgi:hypothetical protein